MADAPKTRETYGTPYTVGEAEAAARTTPMDPYVRDLLRFLLGELKEAIRNQVVEIVAESDEAPGRRGLVCHDRPHGEYDPPCPICDARPLAPVVDGVMSLENCAGADQFIREQVPAPELDLAAAQQRLMASLDWTCLVCGTTHAITDAGIYAGSWMICSSCEVVARARSLSKDAPPAIPQQLVQLQVRMRRRARAARRRERAAEAQYHRTAPGHAIPRQTLNDNRYEARGEARGLNEAAAIVDDWWARLWRTP